MTSGPQTDPEFQRLCRVQMVESQLRRRGIADARVLAAMEQVPRHLFVQASFGDQAYGDRPLPIGAGQTISQPYMVARMTELCAPQPTERALEIGAGSGYQTAVLASLCQQVFAVELLEDLALQLQRTMNLVGCANIMISQHDGSRGWPEHAPFDVILVAAGAPMVPEPLKRQLADGGRLVLPVGDRHLQVLQCITRHGDDYAIVEDTACRFVDLRGEYGWDGWPSA